MIEEIHSIPGPADMTFAHVLRGDGNIFTLIIGGTARLGKHLDFARPENIRLTHHNALYVGIDILVLLSWDPLFEFANASQFAKAIQPAPFCISSTVNKFLKQLILNLFRLSHNTVEAYMPDLVVIAEQVVYQFSQDGLFNKDLALK